MEHASLAQHLNITIQLQKYAQTAQLICLLAKSAYHQLNASLVIMDSPMANRRFIIQQVWLQTELQLQLVSA